LDLDDLHKILQNILKTMDVPEIRTNTERGQNLQWLLRNLGVRNSEHPAYKKALAVMVQISNKNNMLSKNERRRFEEVLSYA